MVQYLVWDMMAAIGGSCGLDFLKLGGEEVQFQVKFADNLDMDILALTETLIDTPTGGRIRLGEVISLEERDVLARIRRENQQYERTVVPPAWATSFMKM
jgi:multidrug efflux pump subunit AcrB